MLLRCILYYHANMVMAIIQYCVSRGTIYIDTIHDSSCLSLLATTMCRSNFKVP